MEVLRFLKNRAELIAHRGYPTRYPENSLLSLTSALEAGARHIEFDVQLSADAVPVLFHDGDLKRITGAEGLLADMEWQALAGLSAGEPERFGDRFQDTGIAQLAELPALLALWPDARAFVEIKRECFGRFSREQTLSIVTGVLAPIMDRCTIISFDADLVAAANRLDNIATGWVLGSLGDKARRRAEELAPGILFVNYKRFGNKRFKPGGFTPWPGPWSWAVYCIDDAAAAIAMRELGFNYVETNMIADLLEELGAGWGVLDD